jgi:hypothetical protein
MDGVAHALQNNKVGLHNNKWIMANEFHNNKMDNAYDKCNLKDWKLLVVRS